MDKVPSNHDLDPHQSLIAGSSTPCDLQIQSRNRHFASAPMENRHWIAGNPYGTAFFNALSVTFPRGETFFIEVLKKYRHEAPEKLGREIGAFIRQEAVHSREHAFFNRHVETTGYDISRLEDTLAGVIDGIRELPPIYHLVATMCLEHMTAIMAAEFIANPAYFENADTEQRNMWLWHASEEIEHKGVAYDTWLHVTKDWSRGRRWALKTAFMIRISIGFAKNRSKGILDLLRQDSITGPRAWFGLAHYALIAPGPFRRTLGTWFQFFKPGFHPWNIDDRDLVQLAESEYEAAVMDQSGDDETVADLKDRRKPGRLPKVA